MWAHLLRSFWPCTVDDAFITFRYGRNLAAGHGPTFNPGQPPVEGYSTFSWMLLMVIPHLLRIDAVVFAKVMGALCAVATMLVSFRLVHRLTGFSTGWGRDVPAAAAVLWLAALPATAIHAVSGMETLLFTLLLVAFLDRVVALEVQEGSRPARLCGLLGLLVGLTRPEGNLAVLVALSTAVARAPGPRRRALIRATGATYLLPLAAYEVWRWSYYGFPFPLAFYVKMSSQAGLPGSSEVLGFLRFFAARVGALAVLGVVGTRGRSLPASLASAALVLFFLLPEPIMAFDWRYLFPIVPVIFVVAAVGLATLQGWMVRSRKIRPRRLRTSAVALLAALHLGGLAWGFLGLHRGASTSISHHRFYAEAVDAVHCTIGKTLGSLGAMARQPLLAVADAGAIPYYSGWRTIDTFGLNDATIARSGRHDPEYVLSQHPDLVLINSRRTDAFEPRMPWSQGLYDACVQKGMMQAQVWQLRKGAYSIWMMADPKSPAVQRLARRRAREVEEPNRR